MPTRIIDDVELYYEVDGDGPSLLLIAGYTCDLSQWDAVRMELASHYRLLLIDNRGVGRSVCPDAPWSVSRMAGDAAGLVEALGIKRTHVLGHSMGGAIAQTLALDFPHLVDRLVISNSLIKFCPVTTVAFRWFLALRAQGHPAASICEGVLPWAYSNRFLAEPGNIRATIASMLSNPHPQSLAYQTRQLDALLDFDSRTLFQNIAAPTLIIAGSDDLIAPPGDSRDLAAGIAGAKLALLENMGHNPLLEIPGEFCRLVADFLG